MTLRSNFRGACHSGARSVCLFVRPSRRKFAGRCRPRSLFSFPLPPSLPPSFPFSYAFHICIPHSKLKSDLHAPPLTQAEPNTNGTMLGLARTRLLRIRRITFLDIPTLSTYHHSSPRDIFLARNFVERAFPCPSRLANYPDDVPPPSQRRLVAKVRDFKRHARARAFPRSGADAPPDSPLLARAERRT